jgi:hypothetical protein
MRSPPLAYREVSPSAIVCAIAEFRGIATLGDYSAMTLSDTSVVITGLDTVTGVRDGKPFSASGRVTFVVAKRGSDWQIVHFHRSAMPN